MNKHKLLNITYSVLFATVSIIAIIFFIKYVFLAREHDELRSSSGNVASSYETSAFAQSSENSTDETGEDPTTKVPVNEKTYSVNGVIYTSDDILRPCNYNNNAYIYNNSSYISYVYPEEVIDFLLEFNNFKTNEEYVSYLHDKYRQLFGEYFVVNNTLVNTSEFDEKELFNMNQYFKSEFNISSQIEYAILVESTCSIDYMDESLSKTMQTDSETEYFISYLLGGNWYIDYMYTDY